MTTQTKPPSSGFPKRPDGVEMPPVPKAGKERVGYPTGGMKGTKQGWVNFVYDPEKPADLLYEVEKFLAKEARKRILGDPTHTKIVQALHLLEDWRGRQ